MAEPAYPRLIQQTHHEWHNRTCPFPSLCSLPGFVHSHSIHSWRVVSPLPSLPSLSLPSLASRSPHFHVVLGWTHFFLFFCVWSGCELNRFLLICGFWLARALSDAFRVRLLSSSLFSLTHSTQSLPHSLSRSPLISFDLLRSDGSYNNFLFCFGVRIFDKSMTHKARPQADVLQCIWWSASAEAQGKNIAKIQEGQDQQDHTWNPRWRYRSCFDAGHGWQSERHVRPPNWTPTQPFFYFFYRNSHVDNDNGRKYEMNGTHVPSFFHLFISKRVLNRCLILDMQYQNIIY